MERHGFDQMAWRRSRYLVPREHVSVCVHRRHALFNSRHGKHWLLCGINPALKLRNRLLHKGKPAIIFLGDGARAQFWFCGEVSRR